jgi:hypothetical protein
LDGSLTEEFADHRIGKEVCMFRGDVCVRRGMAGLILMSGLVLAVVVVASAEGMKADIPSRSHLAAFCDHSNTAGHFTLNFWAVDYDYDQHDSMWFYKLDWDSIAPEIDYLIIELCDSNVVTACPIPYKIGYDEETGIWGIKFEGIPALEETYLNFLVGDIYGVGQSRFGAKIGDQVYTGTICGLLCKGECELSIDCPPEATFECDSETDPPVTGYPTIEGTCPPFDTTYTDNLVPGRCPYYYTIERTWVVTDDSGLSRQCTQIIRVEDTTPPDITCPPDVEFECSDPVDTGVATAIDNCDPNPTVTSTDSFVFQNCTGDYEKIRTWTATDICGNSSSCGQRIRSLDTTPPDITCPPDAHLMCDEPVDPGVATATDNCDPQPAVTFVDSMISQTCPGEYAKVRKWTATDDCGNSGTCRQMITSEDNTPPEITYCPPDMVFACDDDIGDLPHATAVDNCNPNPEVRYYSTTFPGSCPQEYTIVRSWEFDDLCGNVSGCGHTVTVRDIVAPVVTYCPPDMGFSCDETIPELPHATAVDNCSPTVEVRHLATPVPGRCPQEYQIIRSWDFIDECGNSTQARHTISIHDKVAPVLVAAPDDTIAAGQTVVFTDPAKSDNCDPDPALWPVGTEVTPGPAGTMNHVRTWMAQDACGNTSTAAQTIVVEPLRERCCTFTSSEWGLHCPDDPQCGPRNAHPGCLLEDYFDEVFPSGVMIGGTHSAIWTNWRAVDEYLPTYGNVGVLRSDHINPEHTEAGKLGEVVLSLHLNREFSCSGTFAAYAAFGGSPDCFGEKDVPDSCAGKFTGLTIDEFIAIADQAIGGNLEVLAPFGASLYDLVTTGTCINWSCRGCGWCYCYDLNPPTVGDENDVVDDPIEASVTGDLKVTCHPNPLTGSTTIKMSLPSAAGVSARIYDIRGRSLATVVERNLVAGHHDFVWSGTDAQGNPVISGIYFLRVEVQGQPVTQVKLIKL